ncbi:MAG: XTP/dITP diphosphatase [Anaerosomatales bacterium]|nr:XTP/dITP diphosphatase [Anaerosomatales bacterium]
MRVVVASNNEGKLREIRHVLEPLGWEVVRAADIGGMVPDVEETGATFLENALLKARAYAETFDCVALADDSGLEVDALGGAPGVRSARYAGEPSDDAANNAKLLAELADVPASERTAHFRCVVALVWPDGRVLAADGVCEGSIGFEPRGSGGFGYDPLFLPDATPGRTMAELSPDEKSAISHRGSALRALREALGQTGLTDG